MTPSSLLDLTDASRSKPKAWAGYYELTKPRLSFLSVVTALIGYLAALPRHDSALSLHFLMGTALCAAGAAALNQWFEREPDSLMKRTQDRPLPAGQVSSNSALLFGLALSIAGSLQLYWGVNALAATLGAATILTYVAIYTPMKRVSRWATEFGAIPGAIPPLIGWAAAEGTITTLGWILFGILLMWQIPHFMAIAWLYRDDYERGGFPMLSVIDRNGDRVARWALLNTYALLIASALPVLLGYCQWIYGGVASTFGLWFFVKCLRFQKAEGRDEVRVPQRQ